MIKIQVNLYALKITRGIELDCYHQKVFSNLFFVGREKYF